MGLREDAEAARLAGIAHRLAVKQKKESDDAKRKLTARQMKLQNAIDAGIGIGIPWGDEPEHIWVSEGAIDYLQLRSEDGIWLRYDYYSPYSQHRWMITVQCPYEDHWVTYRGWTVTLEGIGIQLAGWDQKFEQHIQDMHPELSMKEGSDDDTR